MPGDGDEDVVLADLRLVHAAGLARRQRAAVLVALTVAAAPAATAALVVVLVAARAVAGEPVGGGLAVGQVVPRSAS